MSLLRTAPRLALAAVALAALSACQPKIRFSDSVDSHFDLDPDTVYDDKLNSPYVAGASFTIYVYDAREDANLDGWELRTSEPGIIEIDEQFVQRDDVDDSDKSDNKSDVLTAKVFAASPGAVVLELYDHRGDYVRGAEVEVMQPDRIEMLAAGPLFLDDEDAVPSLVDDTPKLIADGRATFQIQWFRGEQRLRGAGALGAASDSPEITELWERRTLLDEDREWLTISTTSTPPDMEVVMPVDISANGALVDTVDFSLVGDDAVTYLELRGENEGDAEDGDWLVVLAQAFDDADESIWGVAFDWDLDGVDEPGEGDLFRYKFEKHRWTTLGASYGEQRAEAQIQGVEGFVSSSNNVGCFCSAGEGDTPRGIGFGLLALAGLALVRRRRR